MSGGQAGGLGRAMGGGVRRPHHRGRNPPAVPQGEAQAGWRDARREVGQGTAGSRSASDSDPILLYNPQAGVKWLRREHRHQMVDDGQYVRFALLPDAQHNQSGVLIRRVGAEVGEIRVQGHQRALFPLAHRCDVSIKPAGEVLLEHRRCIVTGRAQQIRYLNG